MVTRDQAASWQGLSSFSDNRAGKTLNNTMLSNFLSHRDVDIHATLVEIPLTEQSYLISCHQTSATSQSWHYLSLSVAIVRHRLPVWFPPMERGCSSPAGSELTSRTGFLEMPCALMPRQNFTLEVAVELHFLCLEVHNAESQCTQYILQKLQKLNDS